VALAHGPKVGLDSGRAMGQPAPDVDGGALRGEPSVSLGRLRSRMVTPLVVGGAGDL
jgi:hypothetical protein